jgi:hypothetical protein
MQELIMLFEILIVLVFVANYVMYLVFRARLVGRLREQFPTEFESLGRPHALGDSIMFGIPYDRLSRAIARSYPNLWKDSAIRKRVNCIIYCQLANAVLVVAFLLLLMYRKL